MNLMKLLVMSLLLMSPVLGQSPRDDQKSLIIVFDGTQSMEPDLEQLRIAVEKIVNEFSNFRRNPIFNYVLSVFRDPVNDPVVRASSPEEFLENLDNIEFIRGGDCPEMSLSGLKAGIQYGLPKSIVYVITDATAKDHNKYNETVKKLIRKKSTVNFLLTGDCGKRNSDGYKAYTNIARLSNGQVFHIETDGIEKVLMALRITMKDSYTLNQNGRTVLPGTSFMPFSVDSTITDISIRLCGEGPKLTIKNPLNQIVTGDVLTMENLQIVSFKNPMVGKWTIDAESSSEYTIQIESNSKLKFEYGFSSSIPRSRRATSGQPQKGAKNYLTFFVSDPSKIGYLSKVTLVSDKTDKAGRTRREIHIDEEIEFNLIKISDHIYATEPFEAPEGMFKVQLHGVDSNGNDIERLVSTSVEATKPSAPEISIIASDLLDGNTTYSCIVNSLIPVLIQWYHQDKLIKEMHSSESEECVITVSNLNQLKSDKYVCKAENYEGTDERVIEGGNLIEPEYKEYDENEETTTPLYDEIDDTDGEDTDREDTDREDTDREDT